MPKLLSIVWYKVLPPNYGGQKGIAHFNDHLAQHYPLVCLCSSNNESADNLLYKVLPGLPTSKTQFINPLTWLKIFYAAKQNHSTHLIVEHPYHGLAGWICQRLLQVKLIVHSHNIEHTRFQQQGKWWWKALMYYERWTHRQADLNLFKTTADLHYAVHYFKLNAGKCRLVPYGVSPLEVNIPKEQAKAMLMEKHGIDPLKKLLLFAGTLDYLPNAKAVEAIYHYIAPLLPTNEYTIVICGRNKLQAFQYLHLLQHPSVVYAGEVENITPYYAAADAFINPLTSSSGVQTKNIDALQRHLNVVCFENNVEGLHIELLPQKMFMATQNNWADFVLQISQACAKNELTPIAFFESMSWKTIVDRVAKRLAQ